MVKLNNSKSNNSELNNSKINNNELKLSNIDITDLNWILYHSIGTCIIENYNYTTGNIFIPDGDEDIFKLFLGWWISFCYF